MRHRIHAVWPAMVASVLLTQPAAAHFVWVCLEPADAQEKAVHVYFSEEPEAGGAHLVDKIAHTEVWLRSDGAEGARLKLEKKVDADSEQGELTAPVECQVPCRIEAMCDYGVFSRGGKPFHLLYYAKHVHADNMDELARAGASDQLALDIVPENSSEGLVFEVRYNGRPLGEAPLHLIGPDGDVTEQKTDADGRFVWTSVKPGPYAVRTSHVEEGRGGTTDGDAFEDTRHYATLTFQATTSAGTAASDPQATRLLSDARASRAVWEDFPGFTADAVVHLDGEVVRGSVTVNRHGVVELEMPEDAARSWVQHHLDQMVDHRMPSGSIGNEATFEDHLVSHPLGRKIRLQEDSMGSVYRIRDDVVTQVNREMHDMRFTITVLEVTRNDEGKYLPRTFSVSFWDSETGALRFNQTHVQSYTKVEQFELPLRFMEVHSGADTYHVRTIDFENHKLIAPGN